MNNKGIGFGVFLLSMGAIWLLVNFGVINWTILNSLYVLWPLILIVIGVNVIFRNHVIAKSATWLAFLVIIIGHSYFVGDRSTTGKEVKDQHVVIEKMQETKQAELKLALGGVDLRVEGGSSNLVDADISGQDIRYNDRLDNGNENARIEFERTRFNLFNNHNLKEECDLSLNNDVLWNMKVEVGAVNGVLDLKELMVEKFDLDMGAGNLRLVFGETYQTTDVKIDAGASKIEVVVPKNLGVRVNMDGAINKTNFNELGWEKNGGRYKSPNYDGAQYKIDMDVDMGVGKFEIIQE